MVVIRPGSHLYNRPYHTRSTTKTTSTTTTTTTDMSPVLSNEVIQNDLHGSNSIAAASWATQGWQQTTQPNFITKPKPSPWEKPTSVRPKPKPTKKPTTTSLVALNTGRPSSTKPKPTKHFTTTTTAFSTTPRPVVSSTTTVTATSTMSFTTTTSRPFSSTTLSTPRPLLSSPTTTEEPPLREPISPQPGAYTVSAARFADCGIPSVQTRPETRIVGGKNAPFGRWPWQVSVRRTSFFGFSSTHRCGGALINENWIATAGHCVDDLLTSQIRIRVGEYDFSHVQEQLPYVERAVAKKVVHPKYNFFTYEYDLALVKLDQSLEFAPHIRPICLPATNDLLIGMNATVTGWGRLSEGGTLPSVLQEVNIVYFSLNDCW